ncbi:hypothetical protein [Roseovarius sp.]|uniref:hypothetical protein n=1 Tax=Roseovarius sp. TaxID=1486281 RepID=UPI003A973172
MSVGRGGPSCATCYRLRWFLTIAGALITGLYLQPSWAMGVARLMPSPLVIGYMICGVAALVFAGRMRHHLRHRRQERAVV